MEFKNNKKIFISFEMNFLKWEKWKYFDVRYVLNWIWLIWIIWNYDFQIKRKILGWDHVYKYKFINLTKKEQKKFIKDLLLKINEINKNKYYYNLFFSNCTTVLYNCINKNIYNDNNFLKIFLESTINYFWLKNLINKNNLEFIKKIN